MMQGAAAALADMLGQAAGFQHRDHLVLTVRAAHAVGVPEGDHPLVARSGADRRRHEVNGVAFAACHRALGRSRSLAGAKQTGHAEGGNKEQCFLECFHDDVFLFGLWMVIVVSRVARKG